MDDSFVHDFQPLQMSSILENLDPSVNNCSSDNNTAPSVNNSAQSEDPILIIDHINSSSTCIDLTEADDLASKDNDDIIVEEHVVNTLNNHRVANRLTSLYHRTSKMSTASASTSSPLIIDDCRLNKPTRRRKRAIGVVDESLNATIIIDDDRIEISPPKRNRTRSTESKSTSSIQCPICLETLEELKMHKKQLKSTMCGHILCGTCFDNMKTIGNGSNKTILCPICRTKLTKAKIHDLFL
jgi:hypothetical protein